MPQDILWAPTELAATLSELRKIPGGGGAGDDDPEPCSRGFSGIHPAILVDGRTGPGADNVGPPSPVPVELAVSVDHQKPESAEVADY